MREKNICRLCPEESPKEIGPSIMAKFKGYCDECLLNPPGTTLAHLIERKEIKHTAKGLVRNAPKLDKTLVEIE